MKAGAGVASENLRKIRAFCHGTAILDELHWTVADGAIRELADHVSTHRMWQPPSGDDRGVTRLALTHRAAGFLVCRSQSKRRPR